MSDTINFYFDGLFKISGKVKMVPSKRAEKGRIWGPNWRHSTLYQVSRTSQNSSFYIRGREKVESGVQIGVIFEHCTSVRYIGYSDMISKFGRNRWSLPSSCLIRHSVSIIVVCPIPFSAAFCVCKSIPTFITSGYLHLHDR